MPQIIAGVVFGVVALLLVVLFRDPARPWGRTKDILGILSFALSLVLLIYGGYISLGQPQEVYTFTVKVKARDSDIPLPKAKVTLDVEKQTSKIGMTDDTGDAVFSVDSSDAENRGTLTVDAGGYERYVKGLTRIRDIPSTVWLETQ